MKKFDQERANNKWEPILEMMDFKRKDLPKMAKFADFFVLNEIHMSSMLSGVGMGSVNPPNKIDINCDPVIQKEKDDYLLPISLRIMEKVKDLDKVVFMHQPVSTEKWEGKTKTILVETIQYDVPITQEQIQTLSSTIGGNETEDHINELIAQKVSEKFNEKIDSGHTIFVYMPVQSIKIIAEKTMAPKLYIISRITFLKEQYESL